MIIYDKDNMPKRFWKQTRPGDTRGAWSTEQYFDDDVCYIRADKYREAVGLIEVLYHWLYEMVNDAPAIPPNTFGNAVDALTQYNEWRDANP